MQPIAFVHRDAESAKSRKPAFPRPDAVGARGVAITTGPYYAEVGAGRDLEGLDLSGRQKGPEPA